jgi:O-antigen/teichoic acid export membrane protein
MSFAKKGALISLSDIALALGGILSNVIFARALGPDGVGQLSVFISVAAMAAPLASLGIGRANIYFLNSQQFARSTVVGQALRVGIVMGAALLLSGTLVFRAADDYFGYVPLGVLFAFAFGMACQTVVSILRPILLADFAALPIAVVDHSQRTLIILGTAALWALGALSLERSLTIIALGSAVSLTILCWCLRKDLCHAEPFDWQWLRRTTTYGLKMAASSMLLTLTSSLTVLIIRTMLADDFTEVGHYTRAVAVATMIVIVPRSMSPLFYAKWSKASAGDKLQQTERAARFNVGYGIAAASVTLVFGEPIIRLLFGSEFLPANSALQILAIAMVLQCLFSVFNSLLASEGRAATTTFALAGTLVVVCVGSLLMVPTWGIRGAALAVLAGNLLCTLYLYAACRALHPISLRRILVIQRDDLVYLRQALATKP